MFFFIFNLLTIFANILLSNLFESDFLGIIAFQEVFLLRKVPYLPICMFTFSLFFHTRYIRHSPFLKLFAEIFHTTISQETFLHGLLRKIYNCMFVFWSFFHENILLIGHKACLIHLTVIANFTCMFYFVLRNLVANNFVIDSSNNRWMAVHSPY